MNLKELFKTKEPQKEKPLKRWDLEEGHVVVPAFEDRGVQYYEIKDLFNTFSNRAMMALQVYEEWEMRLQREDLNDFVLAFEKLLTSQKEINILNLVKVVNMLKERMNFPIPTKELYYRMASVRYFDENESPYTYDPEYNKTKVARWQEATSTVDPFFISQRLVDMMPLPKLSKEDLPTYLEIIKKISDHHSQTLQSLVSPPQPSKDLSSVQ